MKPTSALFARPLSFFCGLLLLVVSPLLQAQDSTPPPAPASSPTGVPAPDISPAVQTDAEVSARQSALDLAGAFGNDSFKTRDGFWAGKLEAGTKKLLEVNLYAGNQYWFSLGSKGDAKTVSVKVFDETGAQVNPETYADGARAAAGLLPTASGPYFVQVEADGDATFCLIYSYK